ncbi:MAG: hypothetical protein PHU68_01255 [Paludibacter sp.]|nr:hypothetical protein [Paludibacter sp.]
MALTPEQEAKLLTIIDAFDGGKRINELPLASSTNPFDLLTEVIDVDGETKQAKVASMLPYLEDNVAYGIEFDTTISSPTCTRVGNLNLHASLPIQSRMLGCLLDDDGNVVEYLNQTNWGAHDLSGARGQVMVEMPEHYAKYSINGTKRRVMISEFPIPGYIHRPKRYISAYEAALDRVNLKLASVVNNTADYRGGNNNAANDLLSNSMLQRPVTSISRTQFRTYARNRKSGSTAWNQLVYSMHKDLYWLYAIEYGTLDSQKAVNAVMDSNGYRQGGLGPGVTAVSSAKWSAFNGSNPFIPVGWSNALGNYSGEVDYTAPFEFDSIGAANFLGEYSPTSAYVIDNYVSSGANLYKCIQACTGVEPTNTDYWTLQTRTVCKVNRYRGIEMPFGHIWKWADGINIEIKSEADGGTSKIYVSEDPSDFNDSNYTNYEMRGLLARTENFIKEVIFGIHGDITASVVGNGAGSTTYFCDHNYTSIPSTGTVLRGFLLGGAASNGAYAGFVSALSYNAPSNSLASIGSRLCYLPVN